MKKLLLFLFIISSVKTFADAGYAYRFFVNVEVKGDIFSGYVYHYSYEKYNETKVFYNYLKETSHRKDINVYKNIATFNLGLNYDFVVKDSQIKVDLSKVENIKLVDFLCFPVGDRLIELNKKEFRIISQKEINFIFLNNEGEENIMSENCSDVLISTNKTYQLTREKERIKLLLIKKVKELKTNKNQKGEPYFKFYDKLQKELLGENYLLISVCSAL